MNFSKYSILEFETKLSLLTNAVFICLKNMNELIKRFSELIRGNSKLTMRKTNCSFPIKHDGRIANITATLKKIQIPKNNLWKL